MQNASPSANILQGHWWSDANKKETAQVQMHTKTGELKSLRPSQDNIEKASPLPHFHILHHTTHNP